MQSGGYLIIEHTEAMHVIDVNSGNRKGATGQENNALTTNLEAAEEVARVLQLRDMGGIICIDFIDMHEKENNRVLFEKMKEKQREYCLKKIEQWLDTPEIIKLIDEIIAEEEEDIKANGYY